MTVPLHRQSQTRREFLGLAGMAAAAAALTPSPSMAQEATTSEIRLERTLHRPGVNQAVGLAPGAKVGYDFTKAISGGLEYYADYGRIGSPSTLRNQQQQPFVVTDLSISPVREIYLGVGIGPTAATDYLLVKGILGRRFSLGCHQGGD